jgi:hypothetical protein
VRCRHDAATRAAVPVADAEPERHRAKFIP